MAHLEQVNLLWRYDLFQMCQMEKVFNSNYASRPSGNTKESHLSVMNQSTVKTQVTKTNGQKSVISSDHLL